MILIAPLKALKAHKLTQAKNDIRYYLNGICFTNGEIWSTNGHVAQRSTCKLNGNLDNGRAIVEIGRLTTVRGVETAIIDTDAGIVYYIPQVVEKRDDLDGIDYKASRLDVATVQLIDGNFPDLDRVYPPAGQDPQGVPVIGFNTSYLKLTADIGKVLKLKYPNTLVKFQGDSTKCAVFEMKDSNGDVYSLAVMPVRI